MKLNWAERWVVNNPLRVFEQRIQIKWFQRAVPLAEGARILEIGCGRGAGAALIWDAFRPSRVHAFDLDPAMVRKARAHLPPGTREKIDLLSADAEKLPFGNESVDAVFGFGFLHHVLDWRAALSEIRRVLKAGGIYFIEELYPPLYLNFITRHLLAHPGEDRFYSPDLRQGLEAVDMPVQKALECSLLGILAVAVKNA